MPQIMPLLSSASQNVSDPEARAVCEDALEQMERIKKKGEAHPLRKADHAVVVGYLKEAAPTLDDNLLIDYMATMCCALADSRCYDVDDWEYAIVSYLAASGVMDRTAAKAAAAVVRDKCKADSGINDAPIEEEDDAEELCNCKFTLAYGTKILLFNTEMRLKRGYRYGLLGKNDCGKTTLMRSIAEGKVEGFPDPALVRTVFVEADIMGEKSHLTCIEYVLDDDNIKKYGITAEQVEAQLNAVGFHDKSAAKPNDAVSTLSGGWRMKLALARAMLQKADILLLDEPTNHLDVMNVKWVQDYLMGLKNVTSIFTSHDSKTLERVATHILHVQDLKLSVHKGNLTDFVKEYPPAKSYFELKATKFTMNFPQPGYIEGVKSKGKALMKMENCSWTYPKNTIPTVEGITVQVSLSSRVAILGPNGAGKSTMIKLLIGENIPQGGTVWKHPAVRVAYVAQHAFHLIENHLTKSPNEYIRWRYEIPGEVGARAAHARALRRPPWTAQRTAPLRGLTPPLPPTAPRRLPGRAGQGGDQEGDDVADGGGGGRAQEGGGDRAQGRGAQDVQGQGTHRQAHRPAQAEQAKGVRVPGQVGGQDGRRERVRAAQQAREAGQALPQARQGGRREDRRNDGHVRAAAHARDGREAARGRGARGGVRHAHAHGRALRWSEGRRAAPAPARIRRLAGRGSKPGAWLPHCAALAALAGTCGLPRLPRFLARSHPSSSRLVRPQPGARR